MPEGSGAANLGQSLSLPWPLVSALPCGMDRGEGPVLCLSPARPGDVCCAPAVSRAPELLCRGRRGLCALQDVSLVGWGWPCWDVVLSIPGHTTVPGVLGGSGLAQGHSRQRLPAGRSRDELMVYPQHREQEGLHRIQAGPGAASGPSPPELGWPCRVSTAGQPRARSLFAVCAAHLTCVGQVPCPLSCRHPSAGRAPHGQHGGHRLQQALSDQ